MAKVKKNTKKKKVDRDFAKKKVKVGKLKKNDDLQISIKTRKIVLPSQLSARNDSVIFKGKSINDLITGSKHTNHNHRISNIDILSELVTGNPTFIKPNINSILSRIGILITDPEPSVRKSILTLSKNIFQHINSYDMQPAMEVFLGQISSGILHRDRGVQKSTGDLLLHIFEKHKTVLMKHIQCIINAIIILLKVCNHKPTVLLYLECVSYFLSSEKLNDINQMTPPLKTGFCNTVFLYKYCKRYQTCASNSTRQPLIDDLVSACLPHIKSLWLEDAPHQVTIT